MIDNSPGRMSRLHLAGGSYRGGKAKPMERANMKISLLLTEDGSQITLTPANPTEKAILDLLHLEPLDIVVKRVGEFEMTQGSYFREFNNQPKTQSTALVLTKSRRAEKTEMQGNAEAAVDLVDLTTGARP